MKSRNDSFRTIEFLLGPKQFDATRIASISPARRDSLKDIEFLEVPAVPAETMEKIQAALRQQSDKVMMDAFYGRGGTTSSALVDPPSGPSPMLPIAQAPRDGTIVMLFCPDESPKHVAAKWMSVTTHGELDWEGWVFADAILADVSPEGPQGATHFYLPFEP